MSDLTLNSDVVEATLEEQDVDQLDIVSLVSSMSSCTTAVIQYSTHSTEFLSGLAGLAERLMCLMAYEGWSLEEIMLSNLAKLQARHGDKFNDDRALPSGRDIDSEDAVI